MIPFITDEQVQGIVSPQIAVEVVRDAFMEHAANRASNLFRVRAGDKSTSLSTMGGVIPKLGVVGVKSYTTINGKFNFVVNLFDAFSGELLCVVAANALTAIRTAAVTLLAFEAASVNHLNTFALFGTGVQAWSHLQLLSTRWKIDTLHVVGYTAAQTKDFCDRARDQLDIRLIVQSNTSQALNQSRAIVTATRAKYPLFDGAEVVAGSFVAAIGSSKPDTRELDEALMLRAEHIIVEWKPQSIAEAGEFAQLDALTTQSLPIHELGSLLTNPINRSGSGDNICIYKSVGVGISDIAICGFVFKELYSAGTLKNIDR